MREKMTAYLGLAWIVMGLGVVAATAADAGGGKEPKTVEAQLAVPALTAPQAYEPKDKTVDIDISEYAGYAGLIVANGGCEPSEQSIFFKKFGFKVRLKLSEEENWSPLNSGKMAATVTTVDTLAVFGKQFQAVVPVLIGFSRGADALVVRSEIKNINGLKGRIIAASQFNESDFFIRYLAMEANLGVHLLANAEATPDPRMINLVYCGDSFEAGDLFLRDIQTGRNKLAGCATWAPKTTEVIDGAKGKANILVSNRNLLIVADILVLNKGFAEKNPAIVAGLVAGLLEGNTMVRANPDAYLDLIGKAFKWDAAQARAELAKVHLANLPENLAFFAGTIDSAGSFGFIYESSVNAYGADFIKDPAPAETFLRLAGLKAAEQSGAFKDQKAALTPIKLESGEGVERDPILSKNIRFLFVPNKDKLDLANKNNLTYLENIYQILNISPGSTVILRGHVDVSMKEKYTKEGGEVLRTMTLKAKQLSKARADEIKRLLIEKHAVDDARIQVVGRGWDEPVSTDDAQNRRVEVQWITVE